jgi:hypothetical protein
MPEVQWNVVCVLFRFFKAVGISKKAEMLPMQVERTAPFGAEIDVPVAQFLADLQQPA